MTKQGMGEKVATEGNPTLYRAADGEELLLKPRADGTPPRYRLQVRKPEGWKEYLRVS